METSSYRVMLRWEPEDEVYTAWVPSLPGCVTFGKSIEEAVEMARDAIGIYLETLISHGEAVPTDESVIERTVKIENLAPSLIDRKVHRFVLGPSDQATINR